MGKLPKIGDHEFSFGNDPVAPHIIVWRDADPIETAAMEAKQAIVFGGPRATREQTAERFKNLIEFALARIVGVKNWTSEAEGFTGRFLEWPADKIQILKDYGDIVPAVAKLYVDRIEVAHWPASVRSYRAAVGDELYPNS